MSNLRTRQLTTTANLSRMPSGMMSLLQVLMWKRLPILHSQKTKVLAKRKIWQMPLMRTKMYLPPLNKMV